MNTKLILKATLATLLMPGTIIGLIPYLIVHRSFSNGTIDISALSLIAIAAGLAGLTALVYCIWGFALHGHGTLVPIDPPKLLVVRGLYRFTRNPMYLAVMLALLSEVLLFRSFSLLVYAACTFVCFNVFVIAYEEPHLRTQFGKSYEDYLNAVPRWGLKFRTYAEQDRK
jgi:protein-S-isoprenylcysteine O-methyltransferase Ste14